jgi:hypothetical protein
VHAIITLAHRWSAIRNLASLIKPDYPRLVDTRLPSASKFCKTNRDQSQPVLPQHRLSRS